MNSKVAGVLVITLGAIFLLPIIVLCLMSLFTIYPSENQFAAAVALFLVGLTIVVAALNA